MNLFHYFKFFILNKMASVPFCTLEDAYPEGFKISQEDTKRKLYQNLTEQDPRKNIICDASGCFNQYGPVGEPIPANETKPKPKGPNNSQQNGANNTLKPLTRSNENELPPTFNQAKKCIERDNAFQNASANNVLGTNVNPLNYNGNKLAQNTWQQQLMPNNVAHNIAENQQINQSNQQIKQNNNQQNNNQQNNNQQNNNQQNNNMQNNTQNNNQQRPGQNNLNANMNFNGQYPYNNILMYPANILPIYQMPNTWPMPIWANDGQDPTAYSNTNLYGKNNSYYPQYTNSPQYTNNPQNIYSQYYNPYNYGMVEHFENQQSYQDRIDKKLAENYKKYFSSENINSILLFIIIIMLFLNMLH